MQSPSLLSTLPPSVRGPLTLARLRAGAAQADNPEWAACATDARRFIDSHVIIDEPHGEEVATVPFRLWPQQAGALAQMLTARLIVFLKARQIGMTWLCLAYFLWLCLFHDGRVCLDRKST